MLQCRNGKRTGAAMVKIAMDMLREGLIDEKTAVLRCEPAKARRACSTPSSTKKAIASAQVITKGLPASPGAATGPVVFFAEDAEKIYAQSGQKACPRTYRNLARGPEGVCWMPPVSSPLAEV